MPLFRQALFVTYVTLWLLGDVSYADDTPSATETLTITGSLLKTTTQQSPNSVQTITAHDISRTSATSLGDYLQHLPSIGSSGSPNSMTNSGKGASCTDLRNLGQGRVLILIDGKRTTLNAGAECVDLNTIPIQQIASVDILKDGGSGLYGADAMAGVINIHLRHDLSQANITFKTSISQYGDGETGLLSAYKGFSFDHGKGNITLFGEYDGTAALHNRNRTWAALPQNDNPPSGSPSFGSSIIPSGILFQPKTGKKMVPDGENFRSFTSSDLYNFARYSTIQNAHQNGAFSTDAHETLSKFITIYSTLRYSHSQVERTMSPAPVQGSVPPSTLLSSWILPAQNPYNPWGQDASITKRMETIGPRRNKITTNTWTFLNGAKGSLPYGWDYDTSFTYGHSGLSLKTENMINYKHLLDTTGTEQLDPTNSASPVHYNPAICTSQAGCSLQNPFTSYSSQAANYVRFTQHDHATYQLRDFNLRLRNPRFFNLPWSHSHPIGVALGMEQRSEQLSYHPDPIVAQGESTGATASYTGGGFTVTEGYGELQFPLLHHTLFAHDLLFDMQGRISHYNRFGTTQNWKTGIHWAPTQDIAFRATVGTSYRQPGLYDLYGGRVLNYASASDPCTRLTSYGSTASHVASRCHAENIDPSQFTSAFVGQLPTLSGGNNALHPETGRTETLGLDLTPHTFANLHISLDYWRYTLRNMITTLGTQSILDGCYTGSETELCSLISPRSANNQLTAISATPQNIGALKTDGIDLSIHYTILLTSNDRLTFNENYQHLFHYKQRYTSNGSWYNYTGRLLYLSGTGRPKDHHYLNTTWTHHHISFTWMFQYISGMKWNNGLQDLIPSEAGRTHTGSVILHDITLEYQNKYWRLLGGVSNIFNKKPPFVADGAFNTAFSQYSSFIQGRIFYLQGGVDF